MYDGVSLFDEPSLQFQSMLGNIPEDMKGEKFIFTKLGAEIGFTVKKAGWVLVLGESDPDENNWKYLRYVITKCWGRGKFKIAAEFDPGELLPGYGRPMTLYAGWCEEGYGFQSVVQRGQTAIIIAPTMPTPLTAFPPSPLILPSLNTPTQTETK